VNEEESDQGGDGQKQPSLHLQIVRADPRKFFEYVLDPDNAKGKDGIFIGILGYRIRREEDGRAIAEAYVE
jgi:hypothetical protein